MSSMERSKRPLHLTEPSEPISGTGLFSSSFTASLLFPLSDRIILALASEVGMLLGFYYTYPNLLSRSGCASWELYAKQHHVYKFPLLAQVLMAVSTQRFIHFCHAFIQTRLFCFETHLESTITILATVEGDPQKTKRLHTIFSCTCPLLSKPSESYESGFAWLKTQLKFIKPFL